jgi:hypothetical protein
MSKIRSQAITGPAAWHGADFSGDTRWIHCLTPDEIAGMDLGLSALKARGLSYPAFARDDFPIGPLGARLEALADELENGRGFMLLRGLPVERYADSELYALTYAIGLHLGTPVRQNPRGDLLGEVMNVGDPKDKHTRVYETNLYLPYHSDPSDVVGLLCLRRAREGGLSSLVSVATLFNQILAKHPYHLGLYFRRWYFAHLCEPQPSLSPIFSWNEGKLSCRYLRQYIELGHELTGCPLSAVDVEALDIFDQVMHDPANRLAMMMEPGDMQFANNYAVLHSRNAFIDHDDAACRRRMLRLWVKMPGARALAPEFPGRNGFAPAGG